MPGIENIIDRQLRRWELERAMRRHQAGEPHEPHAFQPVITVSRQRGSGGSVIAERLSQRFGYTLLHRDIIDRICRSSGHMRRIVESLDGHAKPELTVWFEAMLGQRYMDAGDYLKHLLQIIDSMARLGGVVVVGRGSNLVVGIERGFHVRVVAPREQRIRAIAARDGKSVREAERDVDASDRDRTEFVRKAFGRDINDPLAYDLIVNLGGTSLAAATSLIAAAAAEKFEQMRERLATVPS